MPERKIVIYEDGIEKHVFYRYDVHMLPEDVLDGMARIATDIKQPIETRLNAAEIFLRYSKK